MIGSHRLGIDIGGTFTDLTLFDEVSGQLHILKTPSVPRHPSQAVVDGLREARRLFGIDPASIDYFVHGTTLALNTLLERKGARCGLLVTSGFRDILELQRLRLPNPHEFYTDKTKPLIRRRHVREIHERLLANGRVYQALDPLEVVRAAEEPCAEGIEAVTICFLHAYKNPEHELRAKAVLVEAFPDLYVSASSEIWPQQREYERALLTVMNAYVGGGLEHYFKPLESEVAQEGMSCEPLSTKSNGGIMSIRSASRLPVQTLLSGPASGVRGAMFVGGLAGTDKLITFDLGGTSADIAIINGKIPYATENKVADFPMIMPVVDITSIGAGGGSVAWTDSEGVLKVGPHSAGADPGPAAYNRGGQEATLTDAYITVGILDPDAFLGGEMPLRADLARAAVGELAQRLGLPVTRAAEAIIRVATANMFAELLPLMARAGADTEAFALLPYGGAGPTHAFLLAREIGLRRVIVPLQPGTLCALGCLIADVQGDFIRTVHTNTKTLDDAQLAALYREMTAEARAWLEAQSITPLTVTLHFGADMRYHGQSFETAVDVGTASEVTVQRLLEAFHEQYLQIYGYADPTAAVEIINLHLSVVGETPKPVPAELELAAAEAPPKPESQRIVHLGKNPVHVDVYKRDALRAGNDFVGPVIAEQYDSTVFIPAEYAVTVDSYGNLIGTHRRKA